MRYAFAGDREISINILKFLISKGYIPAALFVSEPSKASHANELIQMAGLPEEYIFRGNEINQPGSLKKLAQLNLVYIISIHFPYIIPSSLLNIPLVGVLNLHPAYLPYNKGWHTPSWAIIEGDPYGATLHFMEEELDQGDIINQKILEVNPTDTANSLYQRALKLEEEVFYEAFEDILSLNPPRKKQIDKGSAHLKKDLKAIQRIDLDKKYTGEEIINKLRGLTTNSISEAAYFEINNKRITLQVTLKEFE